MGKYIFKKELAQKELERLKTRKLQPGSDESLYVESKTGEKLTNNSSLYDILKRPGVLYKDLPAAKEAVPQNVIDEIEASVKYEGYIKRQKADIERLQRNENTPIPKNINYENVVGLSNEVKQKLSEAQPESIARA